MTQMFHVARVPFTGFVNKKKEISHNQNQKPVVDLFMIKHNLVFSKQQPHQATCVRSPFSASRERN